MKKIRVWVVFALGLVTLGIYTLVWLIRRRAEMNRAYEQQMPHWGWLFAPFVSVALAALAVVLVAIVAALETQAAGIVAVFGILFAIFAIVVSWVISLWWIWKFSKAAAYVTNGKMPVGWSLALYIVAGIAIMCIFLQYYFNRADPPEKLKDKPVSRPSQAFVAWALFAMGLSVVLPFVIVSVISGGFAT